jgi:hypothetical protein
MQENSEELPQLEAVQKNATQEDFHTKNKVYELLLYAGPQLEQFPKSQRVLANEIRATMLQILRLVVTLENKHYKKTTLGDLDNEVDVLRHLVRLAADPEYMREKKPCLPMKKYEQMSKKINEIGCMIGGYYKSLNGNPKAEDGKGKQNKK